MEKGGPPYAADGSLDYTESEFKPSHPLTTLISVMQWKTLSACFLLLYPTHHFLPFSHPSSKILPK